MSAELKRKFSEMKVGELRQELGKLGLDKTGVKAVLVDRLVEVNTVILMLYQFFRIF